MFSYPFAERVRYSWKDRKSTRLNSSHMSSSYAVFCLKKKTAQGTFANPFLVEKTGPTAVEPPLYPLFLAALTTILKHSPLVAMAAVVCNIATNAVVAAWLRRMSLVCCGEMGPGIEAGVLWLAVARLMPSWDTGCTVGGLVFFCLFTSTSIERESNFFLLMARPPPRSTLFPYTTLFR